MEHPSPPPELERRVIEAVRRAGGLQPAGRWKGPMRMAAAAMLFLAAGFAGGVFWQSASDAPASPSTDRWMLLLADDATPLGGGDSRAAEYGAWMRDIANRGVRITGAELASGGRVVASLGGEGTGSPLATVGGYFIVDDVSEQEAVALAAASPHVRYGGTIVVKRLLH